MSTSVGQDTPPQGEGWTDLDLIPLATVKELFQALAKALRAHRLYDENNPVYIRFLNSLREAMLAVWADTESIQIQVHEHRLLFMGEEVYKSEERTDSLSFMFWKDGIREIILERGLEDAELPLWLAALQRSRNLTAEGDDLLTILWEADLSHFRYGYVDLLAEGVMTPEAGDTSHVDLSSVLEGELGAELAPPGSEEAGDQPQPSVSPEDFNPTLYSLGPAEMEYLRSELERERQRDLRADVLAALFDRLEEPRFPERQLEILHVLRSLLPNLLSRGALVGVGQILQELEWVASEQGILEPEAAAVATSVIDEMSRESSLVELVQALRDGSIAPDAPALAHFLQFLRPAALPVLLRLARGSGEALRPVLREGVHGIARRHPQAISGLLGHKDGVLVAEGVLLIGRLGITKAIPAVGKLMSHSDPRVRLACLEVMVRLKASTLYSHIENALRDRDRGVRIAGAKAARMLRYQPAVGWLEAAVEGRDIRQADLSEKMAIFEAFGFLAQTGTEDILDRFLNGRGFLGRKEDEELRACAALALGYIRSERSRTILDQARDDASPMVRNAVRKALKPPAQTEGAES
ncbi:MAG: HEAT repeat domain-containing protein [Gemmatimonadetes bacterium]|nr:HEAT repeat domain-containing protein [Gemmatimonadota bacterium]